MNYFDYFEKIYCINLDNRKDRWELAQSEFKKIGILDKVERFSAVEDESPNKGCYESNMQVVKLAKKNNFKNVLIFEDDVAFYKDYDEQKLQKAIEVLKTKDWEFFYLGGLERRIAPRKQYNRLKNKWSGEYDETIDYLWNCRSVAWTHSYAVNSTFYDTMMKEYESNAWEVIAKEYKNHIDHWYQHYLLPKTYITIPTITTQYDIVSDISRTRTNKSLRLPRKDNE